MFGFAVSDARQDAVEVVAGEGPFEWAGDLAVVLAEGQQPGGELVQRSEVVGRQRLALQDREVQLGLVELCRFALPVVLSEFGRSIAAERSP